jgi:hypothetical protein
VTDQFVLFTNRAGEAVKVPARGKHYVEPRGYAAMPGTGPADKQCRHCAHYTHASGVAGNYPKCGANRARWTGGRASDILAKAPACSKFQNEGAPE